MLLRMLVHVPRFSKRAIFDTTLCAKYYTFEWPISLQNQRVQAYESHI